MIVLHIYTHILVLMGGHGHRGAKDIIDSDVIVLQTSLNIERYTLGVFI